MFINRKKLFPKKLLIFWEQHSRDMNNHWKTKQTFDKKKTLE